jgi:hypothetical protein
MGDETDAEEEELGGPLHAQDLPFFVDCFMDKDAHGIALATDVRDIFRGRFAGSKRSMTVQDHSVLTPVDVVGWRMEFIDIEREQINSLPVYWHSIRVTAHVDFPEELY